MSFIVTKHRIIGTRCLVFTAWEPQTPEHITMTTIDGKPYGKIGSRDMGLCTKKYPYGSPERINLLKEYRELENLRAFTAIRIKYPDAEDCNKYSHIKRQWDGSIEVWEKVEE